MIRTERLQIIPLDDNYSDDIFELWGNFEVIKYTYCNLLSSKEACQIRLDDWKSMHKDNIGANKFAILLNNKMIGIVGFPVIDNENFKCGFFYQIVEAYWGNGYAFEASQGVLNYIFETHINAYVIADAVILNDASIKILNKLGFKQTFIEEKGFKNNGMELDLVHFEIDRRII